MKRDPVQVRFLQPYRGCSVGERIMATQPLAEQLIREGIAEPAAGLPASRPAVERAVGPSDREER